MFLQYNEDRKPEVNMENCMVVKIYEPMMQNVLELPADHLILSTGLKPRSDNEEIAKMLKVPLNADGFFLEAHVKLRPVDFSTEGVFVAGTCHSPKFITESVSQAYAATSRAGTLLSQDKYKTEAKVSSVNEEICSGCGFCVSVCPYSAIDLLEGKAKVNEALCKGCSSCVGACPAGAIEQKGFKSDQLSAMINVCLTQEDKNV
jgi:heterodisulfide reductase subunit A